MDGNAPTHTCDRKGPPVNVLDGSGEEPIRTCSICGRPRVLLAPISQSERSSVAWTVFTLLFGVAPATYLAFFLIVFLGTAVVGLFQLDLEGRVKATLLLGICVAGLSGYAALWFAAVDAALTKRTASGLLLGIVGVAGGIAMLLTEPEYPSIAWVYFFGGPAIVASAHLLRYRFG